MPDETTWSIPEWTAAKHQLLSEYLKAWYPILASREKRIGYIDGFAGPGRYDDGEPGSPIVALETLLDHTGFAGFDCDFVFKFIEADDERADLLSREIERLAESRGGFPANISWSVEGTTFVESTTSFLDGLGSKHRLIPALVLIDPFGFKGAPMQQIADLLQWDKCEVIFNFMFDAVNRFATSKVNDTVLAQFDELFGCSDYRDAPAAGIARKEFLRDLYGRQLHDVAKFTYVRSFEMVNDRGRTGNYLFFGTRNTTGLSRMKQAMWKLDPECGTRFATLSHDPDQGMLPFATQPNLAPLRAQLVSAFAGATVSIERVEHFVLTETDYLEGSHLKTKTLKPMLADGLITDVAGMGPKDPSPKKGTFPKGCKITFDAA